MRDREFLVTRLIKASKSHKPACECERDRDSLVHQRISSRRPPTPGPISPVCTLSTYTTRYSFRLTSSHRSIYYTDLCETQQAELQASLAAKERELAARRSKTVRPQRVV